MKAPDISIRQASTSDKLFLWEMLYHCLFVPEGQPLFDRKILSDPEIAKYVQGWGREGDLGFIAENSNTSESIGAVWMRLFKSSDKGFGYVANDIPELAIAVLPTHRGAGVGTLLLQRLIESATCKALSLSVWLDNPSIRLYRRFGFETVSTSGNAVTMLKLVRGP
jgi:ribosomal protein S18 acetylase RimI-like enzyme